MKTLTTTSEQIFASCLGPHDGGKAWRNVGTRFAAAAINSVAKSGLPFAEHYWRDVLPDPSDQEPEGNQSTIQRA